MIGQMIMVGFNGSEVNEESAITKTLKDINVGSVILFNRSDASNIVNYNQTKTLIDNLQKYSKTPLFIAVDAEGGQVNRIRNLIEIKSAYEMGSSRTNQITNEESAKLAEELKALGFNMNLAPVVDINVNNNPAIGGLGRAFSDKPSQVAYQANNFILNHLKQNIITVVKHFPGHGSAFEDSHTELADITSTYNKSELLPYEELNKKGLLKVVMVGHLLNKNIDPIYPASLSSKFIQDVLRREVGFNGVIMSDDLHMLAIKNNYTFEESIVLAINAGTNILVATKNM
jgi:beta-N-acetylhexosaminidase